MSKELVTIRHFFKLIEEINELEIIGIKINFPKKTFNIKFILGLVIGDNLGINSVLEFSRSFSSIHFCRFCVNNKKKLKQWLPKMKIHFEIK